MAGSDKGGKKLKTLRIGLIERFRAACSSLRRAWPPSPLLALVLSPLLLPPLILTWLLIEPLLYLFIPGWHSGSDSDFCAAPLYLIPLALVIGLIKGIYVWRIFKGKGMLSIAIMCSASITTMTLFYLDVTTLLGSIAAYFYKFFSFESLFMIILILIPVMLSIICKWPFFYYLCHDGSNYPDMADRLKRSLFTNLRVNTVCGIPTLLIYQWIETDLKHGFFGRIAGRYMGPLLLTCLITHIFLFLSRKLIKLWPIPPIFAFASSSALILPFLKTGLGEFYRFYLPCLFIWLAVDLLLYGIKAIQSRS